MLVGDSIPEYVLVQLLVGAVRLVTPLSIVYLAVATCTRTFPISPWLALIAIAESSFYFLIYLPRKQHLQAPPEYKCPELTKAQRQALFAKCCSEYNKVPTDDPDLHFMGWFSDGKSLHRQAVLDWILWVFFNVDRKDAKLDEWKEEIDEYLDAIQKILQVDLQNGRQDRPTAERISLDEVKMAHRPLVWYLIIFLLDALTILFLSTCGFTHYSSQGQSFQMFPPRPLFSSRPSCLQKDLMLSYWYRPHKSTTKLPILLIHGLGLGLTLDITLIYGMICQDPDVGVVLLELPSISAHMTPRSIPPRPVMISAINTILDSFNISRVVLAAQSFGTAIASQIIRPPPRYTDPIPYSGPGNVTPTEAVAAHRALLRKVSSVLLLDPISILLHLPRSTRNVLYRSPRTGSQWQIWYIAGSDADTARMFHRAFEWQENSLWKDELRWFMRGEAPDREEGAKDGDGDGGEVGAVPPRDVGIVLAGADQIAPTEAIRHYLTGESKPSPRWRKAGWAWCESQSGDVQGLADDKGGNLDVLFHKGIGHGNHLVQRLGPTLELLYRFVRKEQ